MLNQTQTMSKKDENSQTQQPAFVEELLKNGTVILTAYSREELAEMVNNIPADVKYGAGAVGKNRDTGAFTLQIDII